MFRKTKLVMELKSKFALENNIFLKRYLRRVFNPGPKLLTPLIKSDISRRQPMRKEERKGGRGGETTPKVLYQIVSRDGGGSRETQW